MMASTARMEQAILSLDRGHSRPFQVPATACADLDVERLRLAAFGAGAARFFLLEAVQDPREQAAEGNAEPDQEPEEERAALDLPDDPCGQPEEEQDDH